MPHAFVSPLTFLSLSLAVNPVISQIYVYAGEVKYFIAADVVLCTTLRLDHTL